MGVLLTLHIRLLAPTRPLVIGSRATALEVVVKLEVLLHRRSVLSWALVPSMFPAILRACSADILIRRDWLARLAVAMRLVNAYGSIVMYIVVSLTMVTVVTTTAMTSWRPLNSCVLACATTVFPLATGRLLYRRGVVLADVSLEANLERIPPQLQLNLLAALVKVQETPVLLAGYLPRNWCSLDLSMALGTATEAGALVLGLPI